jgi:hypothetical protein
MKTAKRERNPKVRVKRMPLTKTEMIATLQRMEAKAFLELKESERDYGTDASLTTQLRTRWAGVNDTLKALGIEQDFMLPDNQAATAIICERIRA